MRIFELPDGTLLGFYREQGGYVKRSKDLKTGKDVFGYIDQEKDDDFVLISCVRPPKSDKGNADHIVYEEREKGIRIETDADFLGYAYKADRNSFKIR